LRCYFLISVEGPEIKKVLSLRRYGDGIFFGAGMLVGREAGKLGGIEAWGV
jgi:hypothetical protein